MGWMNDTIQYMQTDPIYRKYKHNNLTFSMTYAFSENFILPLSHDEVVHGKASLINKMPGEYDQKFSNLRAMYAYMIAHPGKKLSFMGNEFAQFIEWRYDEQLDWLLLDYDRHRQMQSFVRDLNHFYLSHPQFWQNEQDWNGFQWVNANDGDRSIFSFIRRDETGKKNLMFIINFTPVERPDYRVGVPKRGRYTLLLDSHGAYKAAEAPCFSSSKSECDGQPYSFGYSLPPYGTAIFRFS